MQLYLFQIHNAEQFMQIASINLDISEEDKNLNQKCLSCITMCCKIITEII